MTFTGVGMFLFHENSYQYMSGRGPRDEVVECAVCDGSGVYGTGNCGVCNGRGRHRLRRRHPDERLVVCNRCGGTGLVGGSVCPNCDGVGQHLI